MPPVRHRLLGCAPENTWQVGSDDFTLPSLFAIVSRLILLGLTVGTIIYLLFPTNCEEGEKDEIPPLLYISLSIFNLVLFLTIVNESVIFSLSLRGRIHDTENVRKNFPHALEVRVALMIIEILSLIVTTVGVFHTKFGGEAIECTDYRRGPLVFAKVIVCLMWFLVIILGLALFFALDPMGCCSPSLIGNVRELGDLGTDLDDEGFILPGKIGTDDHDGGRKRKYHVELGHRKMFRRMRAVCCCFHRGGSNRSSSLAMQDAAKAFHTVFSDVDFVPSDVVAGLILLKRDQRRKKENCDCGVCVKGEEGSCEYLTKELRDLTFEHMPTCQKPEDYVRKEQRPFDFDNAEERAVFEDMLYYMHYCMGIYGWTLHVFQNPLTGFCSLSSVTCCLCRFRCTNSRAGVDIVQDDICLCGMGTMRIQSKREEQDIVFVTYENQVYQTPFSISVDHDRKTVVLAVRGTLSMKDALTDMSVTMVKVKIPGLDSEELYMHNGMYRTAQWIKCRVHTRMSGEAAVMSVYESKNNIVEEEAKTGGSEDSMNRHILRTTMERYWNYQLIVTGHSLGAGVASILAVLLKPAYPHLHCYAYSPPGCIFSMPVAQHSESFITTITLGNDLVIRTSFRSLLYMKKQVEHLVKWCKKPKPQILFQRPWMERWLSKVTEDPTVSLQDVQRHLIPDKRALGLKEIAVAKKFAKRAKEKLRKRSTLHVYIRNINQGDHIPSFPPGRILHMEFTKNAKSLCLGHCYPNKLKLTWKSFEDFGVIAVDRGMVEDHLPTAVMAGLKRIRAQHIGRTYDPQETERIRIDARERYQQRAARLRRGESPGYGSSGNDTLSRPCSEDHHWEENCGVFEQLDNRENFLQNGSNSREGNVGGHPRTIHVAVTLEQDESQYEDNIHDIIQRNSVLQSGLNSREGELEVDVHPHTDVIAEERSRHFENDSKGSGIDPEIPAHKFADVIQDTTTAATAATAGVFLQSLADVRSNTAYAAHTSSGQTSNDVALEMETLNPSPEAGLVSPPPSSSEHTE